jgi:hypothetical protein
VIGGAADFLTMGITGPASPLTWAALADQGWSVDVDTAAAEAGHRVRYTLASKLVNELAEAADDRKLSRTINRYGRGTPPSDEILPISSYTDRHAQPG